MTFGSLFAGIGGMDLGLERAGLECRWQVEIDPFARRILEKHWPHVRRHDDIRSFPPGDPVDWAVDLICGGFPCQDISYAGKGAGLDGERSGLWFEFRRVIRDLRPRYVLVENVSALLVRGLDVVLGDLAALGFDAEWSAISSCSVGSPHMRERMFVMAYSSGERFDWDTPRDARTNGSIRGQEALWPGPAEPPVCGVAHGVPARVDRIRGLGNAVDPVVAERIGRRLMESIA